MSKKIKQIFVDGETYDIGGDALPEGGNTGDVLTKTDSGAEWATAKSGAKIYDCVVAADGTGDYTTIGDAVEAGNDSIFVRNGTYTETKYPRDYGIATLKLDGESMSDVIININDGSANNGYIKSGSDFEKLDVVITNMTFNINTLTTSGFSFITQSGGEICGVYINNCIFNCSGNGDVYLTNGMGDWHGSILEGPEYGFHNCKINNNGSKKVYLGAAPVLHSTSLKSTNGTFSIGNNVGEIYNCYIECNSFIGKELVLDNTRLVTNTFSNEGTIRVNRSYISINTSGDISALIGSESEIKTESGTITVENNTESSNGVQGISNCNIQCTSFSGRATGCYIKATEITQALSGGLNGCYIYANSIKSGSYGIIVGNMIRRLNSSVTNVTITLGTGAVFSNNTCYYPLAVSGFSSYTMFTNNTIKSTSSGTLNTGSSSYWNCSGNVMKGMSVSGTTSGSNIVYANNVV